MKQFAIFGDSHVPAFLRGARRDPRVNLVGGGLGAATLFHRPFFRVQDGRIVIETEPGYYELWKEATKSNGVEDFERRLIVSLGFAATPLFNSQMWAVFGPRRRFVSQGVLKAIVADMQQPVLDFYDLVIARNLLAAVYVAPPPQRSHPAATRLGHDFLFELIALYQAPVRAALQGAQIPMISLNVADEEGFLREAYAGKDLAHANAHIGPLAAEALVQLDRES